MMKPRKTKVAEARLENPRLRAVFDGFQNLVTGLGTERSKTSYGEYIDDPILTAPELERLFSFNDLAATIVSKKVDDALRDGFCLERKGGTTEDDVADADEIMEAYKALNAPALVKRSGILGRLFGGAGLILGVRGAGALETPLDDSKVKKVEFLQEWDRQDVTAHSSNPDGTPEIYMWQRPVQNGAAWAPVKVHATRLMIFPGEQTVSRMKIRNEGWDLSVLQRVMVTLKSFDGMFASTDTMFADCSQAVFKLKGLIDALASSSGTGDNDVSSRLSMMDRQRSSGKALVLDSGDETGDGEESFEHQERTTLGTLGTVIEKYYVRLAAASRYPLTVLLGTSPAGMDATGESDMILYFNDVDIYRKEVLEPRILRVVRLLSQSLGIKDPEDWVIDWPELVRPKPLDVKTADKMSIEACVALIASGAVLPQEVALSLGKVAPSLGLSIDRASRLKALKAALKELEAGETAEPTGAVPPATSSERATPSATAGQQV